MKKIFFKTVITGCVLFSAQILMAQNIDSAERQHSPLIEGNGTSGTAGSNHNPDSKDRQNNGTAVINDRKDVRPEPKTAQDSIDARRNNARNLKGTKVTTSPQNSSSPK